MDLNYSESERLLKESLRDFLTREVPFSLVSEAETSGVFAAPLWDTFAAQGWLGTGVPESAGGSGGSLVDWVLVLEEAGRSVCPLPVAEQMAVNRFLSECEGDATSAGRLESFATGAERVSIASVDAPGAATQFDNYRLSGEKVLVPYGLAAAQLVVFAAQAGSEAYVLTDAGQDRVSLRPLTTQSRDQHARATFDSAPASLIGERCVEPWNDLRSLYTVARDGFIVGTLGRMLDLTVSYSRDRVQFGRPIGSFQAVQHLCVEMAMAVHGAQMLLYQAAWRLNVKRPSEMELAMLHSFVRDACDVVTRCAHQAHGAFGFTSEYPLHFLSRRAKAHQQTLGLAFEHREAVARGVGAQLIGTTAR